MKPTFMFEVTGDDLRDIKRNVRAKIERLVALDHEEDKTIVFRRFDIREGSGSSGIFYIATVEVEV